MSAVFLIGPEGSGKSTVLRALASSGWNCADVEAILAQQLQVAKSDLYLRTDAQQRHEATSANISLLCEDISADSQARFAVELPADIVLNEDAWAPIMQVREQGLACVVALDVAVDPLMKRLGMFGPRATNIVMPRKECVRFLAERRPLYQKYADEMIDTSRLTEAEMASDVSNRVIMLINSASTAF